MKLPSHHKVEIYILPAALFVIALLLRLPNLLKLPDFIEYNEFIDTLALLHGKMFPLINRHAHIGAIANYLYASSLWMLGRHYWVPRVVNVVFASLTIPLIYFLGRRVFNRETSMMAGWLLAGSMFHIYFISHIPWSNCLTPFLLTSFVLCFAKGVQDSKQMFFILSGLLFGLSLQSHPTAITILPAAFVLFFTQKKVNLIPWFRRPGFYAGIAASMIAYGNMIVFHLTAPSDTLQKEVQHHQYVLGGTPETTSYIESAREAWMLLLRLCAGAIETRSWSGYWSNPWFVFVAVVLVAGIAICLMEGRFFIASLIVIPMLLLPTVIHTYDFCLFGRYLGFLIPFACLVTAYFLIKLRNYANQLLPDHSRVVTVLWLTIPLLYMTVHLLELSRTYDALENGNSLTYFSRVRESLQPYSKKSSVLLMDPLLFKANIFGIYLDIDGWNMEQMATIHKPQSQEERPIESPEAVRGQIQDLQNVKPVVLTIVSPIVKRQLTNQYHKLKLETCFAKPDHSSVISYVLKVDPTGRSADLRDIDDLCKSLPVSPNVPYKICAYK